MPRWSTRRRRSAFPLALAATALLAGAVTAQAAPSPETAERSYTVEHFAPDGPTGYRSHVPGRAPEGHKAQAVAQARVTSPHRTGATDERLDIVFIGDGYTADEQADFHADAEAKWADVTAIEPFKSHTDLMNVWTVDAVSRDSGVSGDPAQDVTKDTALGSYFFCDGLERLLCADLDKVDAYARQAPAADIVFVVANSTKYGGAGYNRLTGHPFDGVATLSSDHPDSGLIAVHEAAHSIGHLADEYDQGEEGPYEGPEPEDVNISTYPAEEMAARGTKWHTWLGQDDPAGGQAGTYEGAGYHEKGLYRPTRTSLMRDFTVPEFNNPSREGLIAGFERYTRGAR